MRHRLRIAAYAGLISLVLVPPEIFLEHLHDEHPGTQWIFIVTILTYIASVLCTVLLYYGFYLIGKTLNVQKIIVSSFVIIVLNCFWYTFQVFAIQRPIEAYNIVGGTALVVFGLSRIVFGLGVYQVRDALGRLATSIAILEIVIGLFLVSVFLYFVGFVLSLVAAVMQIMLLMRLSKSFEGPYTELDAHC